MCTIKCFHTAKKETCLFDLGSPCVFFNNAFEGRSFLNEGQQNHSLYICITMSLGCFNMVKFQKVLKANISCSLYVVTSWWHPFYFPYIRSERVNKSVTIGHLNWLQVSKMHLHSSSAIGPSKDILVSLLTVLECWIRWYVCHMVVLIFIIMNHMGEDALIKFTS